MHPPAESLAPTEVFSFEPAALVGQDFHCRRRPYPRRITGDHREAAARYSAVGGRAREALLPPSYTISWVTTSGNEARLPGGWLQSSPAPASPPNEEFAETRCGRGLAYAANAGT
jgi:hypothetical protein